MRSSVQRQPSACKIQKFALATLTRNRTGLAPALAASSTSTDLANIARPASPPTSCEFDGLVAVRLFARPTQKAARGRWRTRLTHGPAIAYRVGRSAPLDFSAAITPSATSGVYRNLSKNALASASSFSAADPASILCVPGAFQESRHAMELLACSAPAPDADGGNTWCSTNGCGDAFSTILAACCAVCRERESHCIMPAFKNGGSSRKPRNLPVSPCGPSCRPHGGPAKTEAKDEARGCRRHHQIEQHRR